MQRCAIERAMTVEVVATFSRLLALKDDWSSLHAETKDSSPFQSPAWLLTWWKHFGSGELRIFAFRDEVGGLAGMIPCFLHEWMHKKQLTLVGTGVSDYLEPLIKQENVDEILTLIRRELTDRSDWDVCLWQDLMAGSHLLSLGIAQRETPCSEILLADNFEKFWTERPSGLRRNVKRYRSKAEQLSPIEFVVLDGFDAECFDALLRLHGARWREQGESGTIDGNRSVDFLQESAKLLARQRMVRFFSLRFQREIAAVIMAFPFRGAIYAYLSAFDPTYSALGFGRLLLHDALRHSCNHGFASWNFLRGEESYKAEWGARPIPKSRLILTR